MNQFKILELFSGNGDISKAFNEQGYKCISIDWNEATAADIHQDIYTIDKDYFKQFNFIWLSPDCTTYSYAQHGIHRKTGGVAVSDYAKQCDENNAKLINLLLSLNIPFIIENPRAHFRHMEFVKDLYRITVFYSTYGAENTKPTDLFSNNKNLLNHFNTLQTRGTLYTDRISYKNFLDRCKMPRALIYDIVKAVKMEVLDKWHL